MVADDFRFFFLQEREAGLNAAILSRDALEDFKDRVLTPHYLNPGPSNRSQIKAAYHSFLNNSTNQQAVQLLNMIAQYPQLYRTKEEFVESCLEAYKKTSKVIHACAQAFRILHSFSEFLNVIKDIPTLSLEQETSVIFLTSFVQYS